MDYQESRAYIKEAEKYGSVLGLDNMREMMRLLGNPQERLQYIHVAGTNGKGSVIAYLYTVLSEAGYRVGRYISPAIYSYRERMEAAGEPVSREAFARCLTKTARVIDEMTAGGLPHPTPFEIETAVAFLFFEEEKCDLVLLEVGLGGGLDATNIIPSPLVAVLASISMDHMAFLGNTLGEIAKKKAGIVKPGCRVVSAMQQSEAQRAIEEACQSAHVPLRYADASGVRVLREDFRGQSFLYNKEEYTVSLAGVCQKQNAVLALTVLECLEVLGYPTTPAQRKDGLCRTMWGGRFSVIHDKPLFVVDGAHNPGAADMLAASIETYFSGKNIYYIMGMFRDKDYHYVLKKTARFAKKILTVEAPDNPRALPAAELAKAAGAYHGNVEPKQSLKAAVSEVFSLAGEEDVVIAFGSLAFIGELTRLVKMREDGER